MVNDFFLISGCAVLSSLSTSILIRQYKIPSVRASSLVTLVTLTIFQLLQVSRGEFLGAAVLGGSFVGMSEIHRLRQKSLIFASLLFSCAFFFILPFNKGLGGALGFMALTSCLFIYLLKVRFFSK